MKKVKQYSCEEAVPVLKSIKHKSAYAIRKFMKDNHQKYHLNVIKITSGGAEKNNYDYTFVPLYITYKASHIESNDKSFHDMDEELDDWIHKLQKKN